MTQLKTDSNKYPKIQKSNKNFEFPGSVIHNIPLLSFTIDHMSLEIKPDFEEKILVDCEQEIKVTALKDITEITLDIAEIMIKDVRSSAINISEFYTDGNEKLIIKFSAPLIKEKTIDTKISYSAGYYHLDGKGPFNTPRNGFHFISKHGQEAQQMAYQTWTQGEALESRYWFPCIDVPQVKFTMNIEITVPQGFTVISNGVLESKISENELTKWKYTEKNPIPSYLVSVVVGEFSEFESKYNDLPINYYWPKEIEKEDAMLTFSETPQMLTFFEEYFNTKYPFQKYTQIAVDNFEFGGMENSSCTTLTRRVLHDKITDIDYKNDKFLVSHELAHQWFGDLVTCKDWPHIWLNEGFATYCESLYWEKTRGTDEFHYNLIESTDSYFEEANEQYTRPIVTNVYKHPDELFDVHSYEKAGFILHMLRNYLGDSIFRKSVEVYLDRYRNKSVESADLLKVFEEISGQEMQSFFDQWIYRKGHPELEIELSIEKANNQNNKQSTGTGKLKIKIIQKNDEISHVESLNFYKFQMEIKLNISHSHEKNSQKIVVISVDGKTSEHEYNIPMDSRIDSISVDPHFKILKRVKSIKIQSESKEFQLKIMLINLLNNGDTVIERVNAIRLLKNIRSPDVIYALEYAIENDKFYGVSVEATNAIGSFYDKKNYEISDAAYSALVSILKNRSIFDTLRTEVKRAIIKNIGVFEKEESIELLKNFLINSNKESIYVKSSAAKAIGKSSKQLPHRDMKENIISMLKNLVDSTNTFQNVVATGALEGLKEFSTDKEQDIYLDIAKFFIENTNQSKDYFIRAKATSGLGKFLIRKADVTNSSIENINQAVFNKLKELLRDDRRKIRMNSCSSLSDKDANFDKFPDKRIFESVEVLIEIAKNDLDGFVRRKAEDSANTIREWIDAWASKPLVIDTKSDVINSKAM